MEFPLSEFRARIQELALNGVFLGTSSWKYEGWIDQLYDRSKYLRYFQASPAKIQKGKFEKTCLAEYATVFHTVCVDAGFYQFPSAKQLDGYFSQVPSTFKVSWKVTEDITVKKFPGLPRYGKMAGQVNPRFLNADLFISSFLGPLEPFKTQTGVLIFEFGRFSGNDWERGRDFVEALDRFLAQLPKGWRYAVEIRNETFLVPEYFHVLERHGVSHTFNSWSRMPSVAEQLAMPGSVTATHTAARFLLRPGRTYEQAVSQFSPYSEIRDPYPEGRAAISELVTMPSIKSKTRYIYLNNRFEGSALWTMWAVLSGLAKLKDESEETGVGAPVNPELH